jgi:hypothetical protein
LLLPIALGEDGMKSSRVFSTLEATLLQLEHAIADFLCHAAPLSETLSFVGLETTLLNVNSAISRALEAERAVQSAINGQLETERRFGSTPRRRA